MTPEQTKRMEELAEKYGEHVVANWHSLGSYNKEDFKAGYTAAMADAEKEIERLNDKIHRERRIVHGQDSVLIKVYEKEIAELKEAIQTAKLNVQAVLHEWKTDHNQINYEKDKLQSQLTTEREASKKLVVDHEELLEWAIRSFEYIASKDKALNHTKEALAHNSIQYLRERRKNLAQWHKRGAE